MGADFIISYLVVPEDKRLHEVIDELKDKVSDLDEDHLDYINEEALNYVVEFDDFNKEEKVKYIQDTIDEDYNYTANREINWIDHKGDKIVIAGGMSWGDFPTISAEKLYTLQVINGIVDEFIEEQKDDM